MTYVTNKKHTKRTIVTSIYTPGHKMYCGWPQKLEYQPIDDGMTIYGHFQRLSLIV